MPGHARPGRPAGYLLNPDALIAFLNGRPQSWLAVEAGISPAHLSQMIAGAKGATPDLAQRLADALKVRPGAIFPELVQFRTQVRHFLAPAGEAA